MTHRVAIIAPSIGSSGGVDRVVESYSKLLSAEGFVVEYFSIDNSWNGKFSCRLLRPTTFRRGPQIGELLDEKFGLVNVCGVLAPEIEFMRYFPSKRVTKEMNSKSLVILVSGSLAWNWWLKKVRVPTIHQVATLTKWERNSRDEQARYGTRTYRRVMTKLLDLLERRIRLQSEVLLVENRLMLNWVRNSKKGDIRLLPPPVDTSFFYSDPVWHSKGHIISVGRLDEDRKGWVRLFDIYEKLIDSWPEAPELFLVGKGKLQQNEMKVLENHPFKSKIKIISDVTDFELSNLLRNAGLFVSTSYEEGLGLAALEGLASGLPIVATETYGSLEYIIPGFNGFLVKQNQQTLTREFANCILRIFSGDGIQMSTNSRKLVLERYSFDAIQNQFISVLKSLLSES